MKIEKGRQYAVLTGDIVDSKKLSVDERRELARVLERIGKDLRDWSWAPLPLDRYRGDGWQVVVADPGLSLRAGLYVRAALRAHFEGRRLDTRVAIGIGTIDFIPAERVAEGDGEAYRLSGAAIDEKGWRRLRFAAPAGPGGGRANAKTPAGPVLQAPAAGIQVVLDLADVIAREWTPAQARAVAGGLQDWTQERIAANWPGEPITQQGVAQHLQRAGWDALDSALEWFEDQIQA